MDYAVEEIQPGHWRVQVAGTVRMIRHRPDIRTFAPWDICTEDGRRLWGSPTLESAFRWIQARTGHPTEGILVEGLLEWSSPGRASDPAHVTGAYETEPQAARILEWGS
jgi:hypothetical protein